MKHGIYIYEQATGQQPPVTSNAATPVFFGTAPVHRSKDPAAAVNRPILCHSFAHAVEALGYSDDWEKWTLCEAMSRQFNEYSVSPAIFVNVFDPSKGQTATDPAEFPIIDGKCEIENELIAPATLTVAKTDDTPCTADEDYTLELIPGGIRITVLPDGNLASETTLHAGFNAIAQTVSNADIIGEVNLTTGARTGIELTDEVFPLTRIVPGILAAPGWDNVNVSRALAAKAASINTLFKAIAVVDVPESAGASYRDIPLWKDSNGISSPHCIVCWPRLSDKGKTVHLSTDIAGLLGRTDSEMGDIPYASPSNRPLQADGISWLGKEVVQDQSAANHLNASGIMTALNWIGGWRAWGNLTSAYPLVTDIKDVQLSVRRMFNWISNTIITTYWQRIDLPIRRVLIDDIETSCNLWFEGLVSAGALLGGRLFFDPTLNDEDSIMNGSIKFRVYICPPSAAQSIEFILEYDRAYLASLFA